MIKYSDEKRTAMIDKMNMVVLDIEKFEMDTKIEVF
jgi:hypothetical protein